MKIYRKKLSIMNLSKLVSFALFVVLITSCGSHKGTYIEKSYLDSLKNDFSRNFSIDTSKINSEAIDYVISGSNFEQKHMYADAILEFQDALKYDSSASIYYAISKNYRKLYKYNKAVEYSMKSLEIDSTFTDALELLAIVYLDLYRTAEAAKVYEKLITIKRKRQYLYSLAYIYELTNNEMAIKYLEELQSTDDNEFIRNKLLELYTKENDTINTYKIIGKIYNANPKDFSTITKVFLFYFTNNYIEDAIKVLNDADRFIPTSDLVDIYEYLGWKTIEKRNKSLDTVVNILLEKLDGRFSLNWRIQLIGATLSSRLKKSDKAIKYYERAIDIADTVADLPVYYASFYLENKKYDEAIEVLSKYEHNFSLDYRFPYFQGVALTSLERLDEALGKMEDALSLDSTKEEIYVQIGYIYDKKNMFDKSEAAYLRALDINPKDPLANNNYAYTLSEKGKNLDKALELINIALSADSANASFLDTYAWILYKMGKSDEALIYIQKAIDTGEVGAEVYEHMGDIYNNKGDKIKAVDSWKKGLDIDPKNQNLNQRMNENK